MVGDTPLSLRPSPSSIFGDFVAISNMQLDLLLLWHQRRHLEESSWNANSVPTGIHCGLVSAFPSREHSNLQKSGDYTCWYDHSSQNDVDRCHPRCRVRLFEHSMMQEAQKKLANHQENNNDTNDLMCGVEARRSIIVAKGDPRLRRRNPLQQRSSGLCHAIWDFQQRVGWWLRLALMQRRLQSSRKRG